ncbi:MAG: L,D-transpeptidase family protein [Alphaproteobacteria bacterium]|nr:L,D-transpeptidase family protein [Alphaproteobacteria bacterium]
MFRIFFWLFISVLFSNTVLSDVTQNIQPADRILVQKSARKMFLYSGDEVVREYTIRLGGNPTGAKTREGDNRTPEGDYTIVSHNPKSAYHLSLRISYPTQEQRAEAQKNGYSAGGDIMIHGYPNKAPAFIFRFIHARRDWTAGCIAVTNKEIEEIYKLVPDGTPIRIES